MAAVLVAVLEVEAAVAAWALEVPLPTAMQRIVLRLGPAQSGSYRLSGKHSQQGRLWLCERLVEVVVVAAVVEPVAAYAPPPSLPSDRSHLPS